MNLNYNQNQKGNVLPEVLLGIVVFTLLLVLPIYLIERNNKILSNPTPKIELETPIQNNNQVIFTADYYGERCKIYIINYKNKEYMVNGKGGILEVTK